MKNMKLKIFSLTSVLAALLAAAALPAAAGADAIMTIRLKEAPLSTLLDIVSSKTGLNFNLSDPELAKKRVTIFIASATVSDIMELMDKAKSLKFQRLGETNNYLVMADTAPFNGYPPLTRQDLEDPALKQPFSVRMKGALLADFLDTVSGLSKVNFVIVGYVQYVPVTAHLENVTVVDILQFLKTKGLIYSRIGHHNLFVVRQLRPENGGIPAAEKAFTEKRYEETISLYKALLSDSPDSDIADYALLRMAVSYDWIAARDNSPAAMKEEQALLEHLVRDYPRSLRLGDAYLYLGQIYSGYGGADSGQVDCRKAVEFYELAIKNTYRDWVKAQATGRIAQCLERDGDREKAAAMYREIKEKYPNTPVAKELKDKESRPNTLLDSGASLEAQSEYGLALDVYRRLVQKGSPAEAVREVELRIGLCQAAMNQPGEAVKTFDAYTAKYSPPRGDEAYSRMGRALEKAGRAEEARKYLEKAGN